jgi:hypothetical protein
MEKEDLAPILQEIKSAIQNAGPNPQYHVVILERHRRQWPTLWSALDKLLEKIQ